MYILAEGQQIDLSELFTAIRNSGAVIESRQVELPILGEEGRIGTVWLQLSSKGLRGEIWVKGSCKGFRARLKREFPDAPIVVQYK